MDNSSHNFNNKFNNTENWRGYRSYYDDSFTHDRILQKERESINEKIRQSELIYHENLNLRLKIEKLEREREDLYNELDQIENDYDLSTKRFYARENDLLDKITEFERKQLITNTSSLPPHMSHDQFLINENRKLLQSNSEMEIKFDLLSNFFNKLQNIINFSRRQPFRLLESMTVSSLQERLIAIEDEISKITYNRSSNLRYVPGDKRSYKMKKLSQENEILRKKIDDLNAYLNSKIMDDPISHKSESIYKSKDQSQKLESLRKDSEIKNSNINSHLNDHPPSKQNNILKNEHLHNEKVISSNVKNDIKSPKSKIGSDPSGVKIQTSKNEGTLYNKSTTNVKCSSTHEVIKSPKNAKSPQKKTTTTTNSRRKLNAKK